MSMPQGRFIQMLATLSQIQQGRAAQDLAERQFSQSQEAWRMQIKQYEDTHHDKDVTDALKMLADAAPDVRQAMVTLFNSKAFTPQEKELFKSFATGQPVAQSVQAAGAAQRGYSLMSPDQQNAVDTESARLARTGMNQGQLANSAMTASALANGDPAALQQLYGKDMATYMLQGLANRITTGQVPFEAATDISAQAQGFVPQAAGFTRGGVMTPAQVANADIGRGGVAANFAQVNAKMIGDAADLAARGMQARSTGLSTASETLARMSNILKDMTLRTATPNQNKLNAGIFNSLADLIGMPWLKMQSEKDVPDRMALMARMFQSVTGGAPVPPPASTQPQQPGQPGNPMSFFVPPAPQAQTQIPPGGFNPFGPFSPRPPQ